MKFERINDKQIRCTLSSFDLSMRNLGPNDMVYGSSKVRGLFTEMMEKASQELGFEADGTPLMIEAIPQADQSIVLVITKVDDPEELDIRFSRFSESPEGPENLLESLMQKALGPMAGALAGPMGQGPQSGIPGNPTVVQVPIQLDLNGLKQGLKGAYVFENIDKAIEAAHALNGSFTGESSLYKNPITKEFFLTVSTDNAEDPLYLSTCNLLSEYGRLTLTNYSGDSYYEEHYEPIIKKNALNALAKI